MQVLAPAAVEYFPAAQFEQVVAPIAEEYFPSTHEEHCDDVDSPVEVPYVP